MLYALTNKTEIKEANDIIFNKLSKLEHERINIFYSSAGGISPSPIEVYYSRKYKFWWGNEYDKDGDRFWNPFGLGEQPKEGATITGRCQINYSAGNPYNRLAGILA